MTKALVAGPSPSKTDFQSGYREETEPSEDSFGPILKLIEGRNEENDTEADEGRTDEETSAMPVGNEIPYMMLASASSTTLYPNQNANLDGMIPSAFSEGIASPLSMLSPGLDSTNKLSMEMGMNPLATPEELSPELKAFFAGKLMENALLEAQVQGQQAKVAAMLQQGAGQPETLGAADGAALAFGAKELGKQAASETGANAPVVATQDFLNMRALTKVDATKVAELEKGGGMSMESKNAFNGEVASPSGRAKPGTESLSGASLAGGAAIQGSFGKSGILSKDLILANGSKESIRGAIPELAESISYTNAKGGGEMRIIVRPDHLGEIHLKVGATKGGKVDVSLVAESKDVADALRVGSQDLQDALAGHRLELGRFEVKVADVNRVAESASSGSMGFQAGGDFGSSRGQADAFGNQDRGFSQGRGSNGDGWENDFSGRGRQESSAPRRGITKQSGRLDVVA